MVASKVLRVPYSFCKGKVTSFGKQVWKTCTDDPRRLLHSVKVGLALAMVSLLVLLQDVFGHLTGNTIWAVMTVVVIFEYTVGATLSKGLNRGLGTILAALLGLFIDHFATLTGPNLEPYIVGFSVFLVGAITTFVRLNPSVKAKYDYGVLIFLLTFCLVVVSGYRAPDNVNLVLDRFVTVILGCIICLLVSLIIFPIWAGNDLQNIILNNIESLAGAVEECIREYFRGKRKMERLSSKICKGEPYEDRIYNGYRKVLNSKATEESLANFATWEPRCGRLKCLNPWKYYAQVGGILRHCAYTVSALHGCLLSEIQAPEVLREVFAEPCINIGIEIAKLLREVGENLKNARKCRPKKRMMENLNAAVKQLHICVNNHPQLFVNPDMWPVQSDGTSDDDPEKSSDVKPGDDHAADLDAVLTDPKSRKSEPDQDAVGGNKIKAFLRRAQSSLSRETRASVNEETSTDGGMSCPQMPELCMGDNNKTRGFAESLSLATVAFLVIEIVSRLEYLLNAVVMLEQNANFKRTASYLREPSASRPRPEQNHTTVQITE